MPTYLIITHVQELQEVQELRKDQNVVAVYALPDPGVVTCKGFCKKSLGWGMHPKNGYMIHGCGKRWHLWNALSWFQHLGKNLLPRDVTPKMFQNPEGWGK